MHARTFQSPCLPYLITQVGGSRALAPVVLLLLHLTCLRLTVGLLRMSSQLPKCLTEELGGAIAVCGTCGPVSVHVGVASSSRCFDWVCSRSQLRRYMTRIPGHRYGLWKQTHLGWNPDSVTY